MPAEPEAGEGASRAGRERLALLAALALGLGLAICLWSQGGQDDKYISYWPARTLAEHGEIVNYNGARLEQSSSLSLVLLLAAAYRLTPCSMPMVGYLASLAGAALAAWLSARMARRISRPASSRCCCSSRAPAWSRRAWLGVTATVSPRSWRRSASGSSRSSWRAAATGWPAPASSPRPFRRSC